MAYFQTERNSPRPADLQTDAWADEPTGLPSPNRRAEPYHYIPTIGVPRSSLEAVVNQGLT